jgi:hypothetical protein
LVTTGPKSALQIGRGADLQRFDARDQLAIRRLAVSSPTGTATEIAMQRSPAEP